MKTKRYQLVEIIKPASQVGPGSRLYIQDQPQLRTQTGQIIKVLAIEAYDVNTVPVSPSGNAVATAAQLKNAVLVLNVRGYEDLQFIPLARLMPMQGTAIAAGAPDELFQLDNVENIDWTKSYLQFCAAPDASAISYLIAVHYLKNNQ